MAFKGLRNYGFISPDTSTPQGQLAGLFPLLSSFAVNVEGTEVTAQGYVDGVLQNVDTYVSTSQTTVDFGVQSVDWITLQWLIGEYYQTQSTLVLPIVKSAVVPATPFTITDNDLTGLTVADVQVTFVDDNISNVLPLEVKTSSPTLFDDVQLTAGTLVFPSSAVGRSVKYLLRKTYSGIPTVGYNASAQTIDNLEFNGIIVGTRAQSVAVNIPKLTRNGTFAISPSNPDQTITYRANVKGSNRSPVRYALLG
jgi:hypothetical protein